MNIARTAVIATLAPWLLAAACCFGQPIPVELIEDDSGFRLLRGGEPYFIKGAGYNASLELLAERGGNSIRTWGGDALDPREWPDGRTMSLMDRAHELGLTVCAGFWVQHFDGGYQPGGLDYDDPEAVERQFEAAKDFARTWKDHPALLVWGIGNEVLGTDKVRGLRELNRIAKAIKEIDPNHPTMTVLSGIWPDKAALFAEHCPDIDILGVNAYGGLVVVPQELLEQGYDGPYVVTEYGPVGHWEMPSTDWGAEIEQASGPKARSYRETHLAGITAAPDRCLGGYVFLWGNKQERTDTWYSMVLPGGEVTQAVDELTELWTGLYPTNRAPIVEGISSELASERVAAGEEMVATVRASDLEGDPLSVTWVVRRESTDKGAGGAFERSPADVPGAVVGQDDLAARVLVPAEPGPYRLHVYVRDGQGGVGTANIAFYVDDE
ncbi:MAG: glycoside hydrolase family 2 TIM barrel-domain containing protein [Planctomycetota bacterium]